MNKLVNFWTKLVIQKEKTIDEIPDKIKGAVIQELFNAGFISDEHLESLKTAKITEMSAACNSAIIGGIDVMLSDGNEYHFSLTSYDQMMISQLAVKAKSGETFLPWHCDGGDCQVYSVEDILLISTKMEDTITYHLTYFNSLKKYITALSNINECISLEYGVVIPESYQTDVLTHLLSQS